MGAPQVTIETITVTRPLKVIAFTCCVITVILMLGATSTADWMMAEGWREGLFVQCVSEGAHLPLPFGIEPEVGCSAARTSGYLRGCAALCIIGLIFDFFGTTLTCLGLKSTDPNKKYKYYRVSIYALVTAGVIFLLAAIIYPVQFAKDLKDEPEKDGSILITVNDDALQQVKGSYDYDKDGVPDLFDNDDDNDGIPDDEDPDDDNDEIPDTEDNDDDNDGILDTEEEDGKKDKDADEDSDNDGTPDSEDEDDDNDGIPDDVDKDDDNDGLPDDIENAIGTEDSDGDGIPDIVDSDDDNDGTVDTMDNDDDGDGVPDNKEVVDSDGDGTPDINDNDDDGDGVPDSEEIEGTPRIYSFGFGYGTTWASIILIFASVVLLICDRESEEIFYKERRMEDEEDEEAGDA